MWESDKVTLLFNVMDINTLMFSYEAFQYLESYFKNHNLPYKNNRLWIEEFTPLNATQLKDMIDHVWMVYTQQRFSYLKEIAEKVTKFYQLRLEYKDSIPFSTK